MDQIIFITFFFLILVTYFAYCILFNYDDRMIEYVQERNKFALILFSFFSVISFLYLVFYIVFLLDIIDYVDESIKDYSNAITSQLFIIIISTFFMAPSIMFINRVENWLSKLIYIILSIIAAASSIVLMVFIAEHIETLDKNGDDYDHTIIALISSFFLVLDYFVYNFIYGGFILIIKN